MSIKKICVYEGEKPFATIRGGDIQGAKYVAIMSDAGLKIYTLRQETPLTPVSFCRASVYVLLRNIPGAARKLLRSVVFSLQRICG